MAVEEYVRRRGVELGREAGQQRQAGAELVDEEAVGLEVGELAREDGDLQDEVYLAEDGAEDGEARQDRRRHDGVAADADVESAVAGFVEAVTRVAVAREDDDSVAALLQANGSVHDQALGAADAQIRCRKTIVLPSDPVGGFFLFSFAMLLLGNLDERRASKSGGWCRLSQICFSSKVTWMDAS